MKRLIEINTSLMVIIVLLGVIDFVSYGCGGSTSDLKTFLNKAVPICEAAFSSPVNPGAVMGPVLALVKKEYQGQQWDFQRLPFIKEPASASEVKTLVCIKEGRREISIIYTDGSPGYILEWNIRLVRWPDGRVIHSLKLSGGFPPSPKKYLGPGYGTPPIEKLLGWLLPALGDKTVFYHDGQLSSIAFSPDGKLLASAYTSFVNDTPEPVKLWDVQTAKLVRDLTGHKYLVSSVAFSPDGKLLASGSWDKSVKLWDVINGKVLRTLTHAGPVESVVFSPDGKTLASASYTGREPGERPASLTLWNVATGQIVRTFIGHNDIVSSVAFSPDGKLLASGSWDKSVKLWDVSTGTLVHTLNGHKDIVQIVAFSPDGKLLAASGGTVSGEDSSVKLWNVETEELICILTGHTESIEAIAFSLDGKMLASGGLDKTVKLWDTATWKEKCSFQGHVEWIKGIAFSPDGRTLASGSEVGMVKLWNVETGK